MGSFLLFLIWDGKGTVNPGYRNCRASTAEEIVLNLTVFDNMLEI